jgi:hypothetical protein
MESLFGTPEDEANAWTTLYRIACLCDAPADRAAIVDRFKVLLSDRLGSVWPTTVPDPPTLADIFHHVATAFGPPAGELSLDNVAGAARAGPEATENPWQPAWGETGQAGQTGQAGETGQAGQTGHVPSGEN